jgi:two-component system, OmpR family, phosphate regulon response regulator PhoB
MQNDLQATHGSPAGALLKAGDIELDQIRWRVTRGVRDVRAGPAELRLLALLMQNRGRVLTRDEILNSAWPEGTVDVRTVDVYIGRLRRALNRGKDRDPIRTVRNAGYIFELAG